MRDVRFISRVLTQLSHLTVRLSRSGKRSTKLFYRRGYFFSRHLSRAMCLGLVLSMLATSTPAAPQTVVGLASQWQAGFAFWWRSSGLEARLLQTIKGQQQPARKRQEKQRERDANVSRIEIYPGDVTLRMEERVAFAAVAYDPNGASIGGVRMTWSGLDVERNQPVGVSQRGDFVPHAPGIFKITAQAANQKAQVTVTVLEGVKRDKGDGKHARTRKVSTHDLPSADNKQEDRAEEQKEPTEEVEHKAHASRTRRASYTSAAPAPMAAPMSLPPAGYDNTNYWSADDPGNVIGNPPGQSPEQSAGNGNFQLTAPVFSVPGRGINIALGLAYNSRLWNKAGSQMTYDVDRGWPAPGWALGFGKVIGMGVNNGSMIIEADGTRHGYTGTVTYGYNNSYTYFTGHTTDGSFIDYTHYTGTGGALTYAQARYPNGTVIEYAAPGTGAMYPTRITDPNGNYITITYVNNNGPRIQTITDALGRILNFHYDYNNLLTAVTAPGLNGSTRTMVRLHYHQMSLNYGFNGLSASVSNPYPWVIDAIYYPATGTGYWFGDGDSYSSYGMIAKVQAQRGMGFSSSSLNDMGYVTPGYVTQQQVYSYPLQPDYSLTDAPTYSTLTESWQDMDTAPAVTTYTIRQNDNPRSVTVTRPDGSRSIQYSNNHPGVFDDGLASRDEVRDASNNLLHSNAVTWQQGAYGAPRPLSTTSTDERGQATTVGFSYGSYNQVTEVRDYDYNNALLRSTRTQYENGAQYTNQHIFNLVNTVEVYAADGVTRVSRTDYQHDGQPLTDTPGVVMHSDAYNPHAPQYLVPGACYYTYDEWGYAYYQCDPDYWTTDYNPATDYRGNVTQVTTYGNAAALTGAVVETRRYDITGNMVNTTTSCCQQTNFNYTVDTQYAYPLSNTKGSPTDTTAQVRTSATYDFNTGLTLTNTDANGRVSQTVYQADSLRAQTEYLPAKNPPASYTTYSYDEVGLAVTETTYTGGGVVAEQNVKRLNGLGQVRHEEALGTNNAVDVVDTRYDVLGRVWQQTNPYRNGETPQWNVTAYDVLSRVVSIQGPDGSTTQAFYNEAARPNVASGAAGQTRRLVDAWGRERWGRADSSGRLVEIVEPDPAGNGSVSANGLVTTYGYDTLNNLVSINQGSQVRYFRYDSLGHMTHQKLSEASPTLNDYGQYVGAGTWSDVFAYDDRSNLISRIDARGVKTLFNYGNDPLNRLQSISYDTSGFGDTGNPILTAANINYSYVASGDVMRLNTVTTAGISTEGYSYDGEGRLAAKTLTVGSRSAYPMLTDYIYDTLDRVTDVRYPAEYGNGPAPRKVVHHNYDVASRLSGLQVDGADYASQVEYNAASQTTYLKVGASSGLYNKIERYRYNAQTGLLEEQMVLRDGITPLLDLFYDYAGANGKRTGQLVKATNYLDTSQNHDRNYSYDALGRLTQARGGPSASSLWSQNYAYDRYGNRTSVTASGNTAGTPPPSCSPSQTMATDQYIRDFYQAALNRQPTSAELQSWGDLLRQNYYQGQAQLRQATGYMGRQIFKSTEYQNRNRTDREFVYDLYKSYLQRDPDQGGWDAWTNAVPGNGRDNVRLGFEYSQEFSNKVGTFCPRGSGGSGPMVADGLGQVSYDAASNRVNSAGFTYDAAGNQTRVVRADGSAQRFQYDAAGRLVKVKDDYNYTLQTSTYGASSQRLIVQDGDENSSYRTYYAWSGEAVIVEYSETASSPNVPQWTRSNIYLGSRLLSTLTPNGAGGEVAQYHHPDRLGTRLITNSTDNGVQEQVTLPFGTALDGESTGASKRRFTSYERSAMTGLDYAVNRHYDSQQGRFTQADPIGIGASSPGDPQSLNMYAYCGNDPVNRLDPDGLFWGKLFRGIFKILTNKWVRLIIAVALVVLTFNPSSLIIYNYTFVAGAIQSTMSLTATGWIAAGMYGALAVGQVGNSLQAKGKPKGKIARPDDPNCFLNTVLDTQGLGHGFKEHDGQAIHDGDHIRSPLGRPGTVVTVPALSGQAIYTNGQGDGLNILDVRLKNGDVAIYKDLTRVRFKSGRVGPGTVVGNIRPGTTDTVNNVGLHLTIIKGEFYDKYRQLTKEISKLDAQKRYAEEFQLARQIRADWFIRLNDPNSPVKCKDPVR